MKKISLFITITFFVNGCISFRNYQQREYDELSRQLQIENLPVKMKKEPSKAGWLNFLPGIGNAYLDQWGVFAFNLITWPFSILWGVPQAVVDAENINKKETLYWYTFGPGKYELASYGSQPLNSSQNEPDKKNVPVQSGKKEPFAAVNPRKKQMVQGLSDTLRTVLVKTNYFTILERSKMEELLKEQSFQFYGTVSPDKAVEVGKMLGVDYMVIGSLSLIGSGYVCNIRVVSVQSGEIILAEIKECRREEKLVQTVKDIGYMIAEQLKTSELFDPEKTMAILDIEAI